MNKKIVVVILISVSISISGVLIYIALKNKKDGTVVQTPANLTDPKDGWPMQNGSSGPFVSDLQNAIIAAYGTTSLPMGATGKWDSQMDKVMKSKFGIIKIDSKDQYYEILSELAGVY